MEALNRLPDNSDNCPPRKTRYEPCLSVSPTYITPFRPRSPFASRIVPRFQLRSSNELRHQQTSLVYRKLPATRHLTIQNERRERWNFFFKRFLHRVVFLVFSKRAETRVSGFLQAGAEILIKRRLEKRIQHAGRLARVHLKGTRTTVNLISRNILRDSITLCCRRWSGSQR